MDHLKIFSCLAIAAALLAFAGTASATTFTSGGATYTGKIDGTSENAKLSLHGSNGVTFACNAEFEGNVGAHGSAVTAEGAFSLGWSGCEGGEVKTIAGGTLIAHVIGAGPNATITSTGAKIEASVNSEFGKITCIYATTATPVGTLTGSTTTGGKATLDISATIPRTEGSALCGATGTWTGSYAVWGPLNLNVH